MPHTLDRTAVASTIRRLEAQAGIAQLVEHNLAKVGVASSNLVSRSISFLWLVGAKRGSGARMQNLDPAVGVFWF